MGAKKYLTIEELAIEKDIKLWRLKILSMKGLLPIRFVCGEPIIPYEIDVEKFDELESVKCFSKAKKSSLKIEEITKSLSRRKEDLWQK